jgi:hypothetical protein
MNSKLQHPIIRTLLISIIAYLIHKGVLFLFTGQYNQNDFIYSLELLYGFFFISSALIITILLIIMQKNVNNVGFVFLLLTTLKMGIACFFLKPILDTFTEHQKIEKINFFIIFTLFLAIETVISVRMLNKKQ